MKKELIAACGTNCGVCMAHLRETNRCPGCSSGELTKTSRVNCKIRLCEKRTGKYCYECAEFPCARLAHLDQRYREKYGMSQIENLEMIREQGMDTFLENEEKRWVNDDGIFCVHNKKRFKK